mmetsp:Transcript_13036/g.38838  ORF Transcript_13036/g.38838 Transcript_13036/m.38838 type:complete len:308 (-) Transcript_13036:132-1055(-)
MPSESRSRGSAPLARSISAQRRRPSGDRFEAAATWSGEAFESWFCASAFAPASSSTWSASALPHMAAMWQGVWPSEFAYDADTPSDRKRRTSAASLRCAAARIFVFGSRAAGTGCVRAPYCGARARTASSSICSRRSMAKAQTPRMSSGRKGISCSLSTLAMVSRAALPWSDKGGSACDSGSVQGRSSWQAMSSAASSPMVLNTSACVASSMRIGMPVMARRELRKSSAMAMSMGEHEGSPHCTSRTLMRTCAGSLSNAVRMGGGSAALTHSVTRWEAVFWLMPPGLNLRGSNMAEFATSDVCLIWA